MMSMFENLFANVPDFRPRILLLGNYRPALAVARILRPAGYCVVMGKRGGEGFSEYSRFVEEAWDHPPVETDPAAFGISLQKFLAGRPDIQLVLPITEAFVMFFAETMTALPDGVTLVSPKADLVKTCADKAAMLHTAVEADVPVLPYAILEAGSDMTAAGRMVGLPMVARPLSPGDKFDHKKAVIIENWADYKRFVSMWCDVDHPVLIQRRAFGPRHNFFFTARHGGILSTLETHIRRTDYLDGTGVAVEGVTAPTSAALLGDVSRLTQALNYTGIGLAQFIVDPVSGERCFLELNPRIAGSQAITEQMGLEMARTAIDLAKGLVPDPPKRARLIRAGFRYAWSYGDLRGLRASIARDEVSGAGAARWFMRTLWTAIWSEHHMTWSWHDPLPSLMLFMRQIFPSLIQISGTSGKDVDGGLAEPDTFENRPGV
jgi:predicted ATP-grasp superfamily ATP-dependent carboligase